MMLLYNYIVLLPGSRLRVICRGKINSCPNINTAACPGFEVMGCWGFWGWGWCSTSAIFWGGGNRKIQILFKYKTLSPILQHTKVRSSFSHVGLRCAQNSVRFVVFDDLYKINFCHFVSTVKRTILNIMLIPADKSSFF